MNSILTLNAEERASTKQVSESKDTIDKLFKDSANNLTAIVQQNIQFEQERSHLFQTTQSDFNSEYKTIKKNVSEDMGEIESEWTAILQETTPLEMNKRLEELKEYCDGVIQQKLDFIKSFEEEILKRDHEYVNKIAEQKQRVDNFVHQMRNQEMNIRKSIANELEKIKAVYIQERNQRSFQIDKETKNLSTRRQERESELMNEVINLTIKQRDELEALRQKNNEAYMQLRTALEFKLQTAEREHEERKAQYVYSLSQLEYDYRILQENREEHINKIKLQNDKMIRQRELIRKLKRRYKIEDAEFIRINKEITHDYRRIAQNYRELQSRFRNVAYNDFNNFRKVWNMNEKRLHDLVLKVIEADRVVMNQQLGKEQREINPEFLKRWTVETNDFEDLTKTPQLPKFENGDASRLLKMTDTILTKPELSAPLEHLRKMISDEVGFLVDERVKNLIGVDSETEDIDGILIRIDVLLQELGVTEEKDVELLLTYFIRDREFELDKPEFLSPHEVLDALRRFVDAYHPTRQNNQMSLFAQITQDATQNTSSEVARAIIQLQQRMKRQLPAQRKFWETKASVITEDMYRLWTISFKGMQRYNKILEERANLIIERERLIQQNAELETMLARSIQSPANDALIYPPGHTVDFNQFN